MNLAYALECPNTNMKRSGCNRELTVVGGDCKTLMFVQISPSSTDSGETLCSLNFASRVRAIEHGPARKQVDPAENFKLKQMVLYF